MRIFLMIGQSNMAGRGQLGLMPPIVNPHVRLFRDGQWMEAREPVNPDRVFSGESMQLPFADAVQKATGEDVGLIPCAEGGTLLRQWAPGDELFSRAAEQGRLAMRTAPLSGILWIQGENDGYSQENAASYTTRFLSMLDTLTKELGVPESIPVIVAELCPFLEEYNRQAEKEKQVPYFRMISDQLARLPNIRANIRCVRTAGLTGKPDGIHYDTPALRELGKRFAEAYLSMTAPQKCAGKKPPAHDGSPPPVTSPAEIWPRRCAAPGGRRNMSAKEKRKLMPFRVGIAGCGNIAATHAAVLQQLPDTQLSACADIRMERARAMAEQYGCRAYDSLESMLENESLDAVHLCVPHFLHAPMTLMAAGAGAAVMCEKPPVIDFSQWAMLEEAAKKVPVAFCFQNRYNANVQAMRSILRDGSCGPCLGARAFVTWARAASYYTESGWRGSWDTEGGGALINQSIHTLDLLIHLMGRPETVEAHMANHHLRDVIEVEDTVEAYMTCQGRPVLFYASTAYAANAPVLLEFQMEKAACRLEKDSLEIRTAEGIERRDFSDPGCLGRDYWGSGHRICIADFYNSLKNGSPLQNGLSSVRDTVDTMLQMYRQFKGQN